MRQTEKFGLNLPDWTDPLSLAPINENTETIANLFGASARVCCGTYTGDGGSTGRIETPGMRPVAVLMNARKVSGRVTEAGYSNSVDFSTPSGWIMWVGEDLPAKYATVEERNHEDPDLNFEKYYVYTNHDTTLKFYAESGSLAWALEQTGDIKSAAFAVNNSADTVYQWIAFGVPE